MKFCLDCGIELKGHNNPIRCKHCNKLGHKLYKGSEKGFFKKGINFSPKTEFKKGSIPWIKGKHLSEETKEKIRLKNKNYKPTEETKRKISKALKGNKSWRYIDGRSYNKSPIRYGDDWEAIRYLVYLRDHFTCQECGITKKSLDIHHKIPFLDGGSNNLDNLITLCRSCHMKIERLKIGGNYNGQIKNKIS